MLESVAFVELNHKRQFLGKLQILRKGEALNLIGLNKVLCHYPNRLVITRTTGVVWMSYRRTKGYLLMYEVLQRRARKNFLGRRDASKNANFMH